MKTIIEIIEGIKIGSKSKINNVADIKQEYNDKKKLCVTKEELSEIEQYAEDLPILPITIKTGTQGNIKLIWDKTYNLFGKTQPFTCNISKPTRYEGSFKITMDIGRSRPYEYPMGTNNHLDKNGNLKLPDIKSTFKHIHKIWDKYDLTSKLK